MRKILSVLLMSILLIQSFSVPSHGATRIENPRDIIIAQPGSTYSSSSSQVSILGASDWDLPLYLNGSQVDTTDHGFFAEYVSLKPGQNDFTFTNGGKTKTVSITYTPPTSGGGTGGSEGNAGAFDPTRYLYLKGSTPLYGTMKVNNGSRARDNLEKGELMPPLAKGTRAQIIGEDKYFYMLSDYSFVYKSGMDTAEGTLPQNYVTGIRVEDQASQNGTEVFFKMNLNTLYDYSFDGNRLVLTLFGSLHWAPVSLNDSKLVKKITSVPTSQAGACSYEILLDQGSLINGVYLEFRAGEMVLGFKKAPLVKDGSLKGVKIFLDPGHGGTDPGAFGPLRTFGPSEKDINLEISRHVYKYLTDRGATVITSRMDDTSLSLAERMEMIISSKPDLSLSVHSNSVAVTTNYDLAKGYRTYYTYALPITGEEDAVSFISRRVAEITGLPYTDKNRSNLAMARTQYCPAMIFEVGFMSNPEDYEWLVQAEHQKLVGEAIGKATLEWFETLSAMEAHDRDSIKVLVNGQKVAFDVDPFIEAGRTLVPLRRIFEALGATVTWNEAEQTATVVKGAQTLQFKIGDSTYTINQVPQVMDVTARIVEGGRTVVPLRVLSEALGYEVDWFGETKTIEIF
jgi:N-acetylmuramoyl-L-alanine amidase